MQYYPINLRLSGRSCAVIGGGAVAERKVKALLASGAKVTVYSPQLTTILSGLARCNEIVHVARPYCHEDLTGFFLVICATDNREVNLKAARDAQKSGALVNVVDEPEECDFIVPSKVIRGDLLFTVSTNGKSPAFAKSLRRDIEEKYGPEYGYFLEQLSKMRIELKNKIQESAERERIWRKEIDAVVKLLKDGKFEDAEEKISNAVSSIGTQS